MFLSLQNGQVFTWGCADDGSLGRVGDESKPLLVAGENNAMLQHHFICTACGDGQTLALTSRGEVWGWGCYKDKEGKQWFDAPPGVTGKAALKVIKRKQDLPQPISFFQLPASSGDRQSTANSPVADITCGSSFNLARCEDGKVYSWGTAECGELARKTGPMKIPDPNGEEGAEVYDNHTVLHDYLTPSPMQYVIEPETQLGDGEVGVIKIDGISVREVRHIKAFGGGSFHTLLVMGRRTYASGLNNYGQLGLGDTNNRTFLTEITALRDTGVMSVKGGVHHSLVLTSTGQLLAFGRGDSGQLGVPAVAEQAGAFVDVPIAPGTGNATVLKELESHHFTSIACGNNHCLAVAAESGAGAAVLYSWGYGDMLALGHGVEKDETAPRRVAFGTHAKKNPVKLSGISGLDAGGQHSVIIGQMQ